MVDGQPFTPEELVAMVLTHAKDITNAYGVQGEVKDCVLTVPSFYTQHERRALLDAAALADLNVLALIDENTAAGLHYGIDRVEDVPQNVLFYNMGASALQVSVMQFYSYERKESKYSKPKKVGAFQVLGKAWDSSLGGIAFDARIVDFMADEFNEIWNKKRNDGEIKDVRNYPRPMSKLRIQAKKVKHVLSANTDVPIFIDSLYDDTHYQSHMSRATFEEICHDLLERSSLPITNALKAANLTLDEINSIELIGGGMRVPKIQESIQHTLGDKLELGMHINSDESMALGAAFHGANISTAFKVRHVGMTDINPFPIAVSFSELGKTKKNKDAWSKQANIFKSNGKVGVKKTIAFTQEEDIECHVYYEESEFLPQGTETSIEKYSISGIAEFAKEMSAKKLAAPKVSLQFELSSSGLVKLVKAEAAVEEVYTVTEEVEVDEEENKDSTEESKEKDQTNVEEKKEEKQEEETKTESKDSTEETEKKEEEKPKKKITVEKEKKRTHKRALSISSHHIGAVKPYSDEIMAESRAKLNELARVDKERMMLEEIRNNYESYIYLIKNKLVDFEDEIAAVSTQEQREELLNSASKAEDWMYDEGYDADFETYTKKYEELSAPAEKVFFRMKEVSARADAIKELNEKLDKVDSLMKKWETTMPHVTEEERGEVLSKVGDVRKWIEEKTAAQAAADPTADPVFTSAEVPLQTTEIQKVVSKLSRKPKPAPKKEEETANKDEQSNQTDASEDGDKKEETNSSESSAEGSDPESESKPDGEEL